MKKQHLLHLLFQALLLFDTWAWEVKMPKDIHGLRGSCLVVPCSFSYTSNPPKNPNRVVWYQWVPIHYPLVYDPLNPNDVIAKFKGKTDLYGNSSGDCSLLIKDLDQSHHREAIYTWIDPENVGKSTYAFFKVTSTILIDVKPQLPIIYINGGQKMGDSITVVCSAFHTCPYSKPEIILNGVEGSDQSMDKDFKDGLWKVTLTRTGVVKSDLSTIDCSVTYYGGKTVKTSMDKNAKCVPSKISIEPEMGDVTVGVAKNFTCVVRHSCQRETPTITWNYKNMTDTNNISGLDHVIYSNITILGSKEDHEKMLICRATSSGGNVSASVVLHVHHPTHTGLKTVLSLLVVFVVIISGVVVYKKRLRPKNVRTVPENTKLFFKAHSPSNKSVLKPSSSVKDDDYEDYCTNMDELPVYANI